MKTKFTRKALDGIEDMLAGIGIGLFLGLVMFFLWCMTAPSP